MIDLRALAKTGLTNERLEAIFTIAQPGPGGIADNTQRGSDKKSKKGRPIVEPMPAPGGLVEQNNTLAMMPALPDDPSDWDIRRFWESRLMMRTQEGIYRCAQNFNIPAAIDLAYSSKPIHPMTLPLMRAAEGMISLEECQSQISRLTDKTRDAMFTKDAQGKLTGLKAPQLVDVSHNLVHSLVTRRTAAIATEVMQRYPFNVWNPFSNSQEGKFVADVMTQLGEQMAGAYDYSGDAEESTRATSLYGYSVKFKANAWHTEKQRLPARQEQDNGAKDAGAPPPVEFEDRIVREGVKFILPHPSRVYFDIAHPLRGINKDLGPDWIGHWNVVKVSDIKNNPAYFNKDKAIYSTSLNGFFNNYAPYFSQYFPNQIVVPAPGMVPGLAGGAATTLALSNDRVAQIGSYAASINDVSTTLAEHYERVIPKDVGLGTYPFPVWLRFVVAAQQTVVYAEICGSCPASVNMYNKSDNLIISPSFAMQVLPFQEHLTNLLTEILRVQYMGMVRIWTLNKQGMTPEDVDLITKAIQYPDYANAKDIIIKYDALQLVDRGQDPRTITQKLEQIKTESREKITELFATIVQLLAIAERLLFFSPQELGQVSPRTITAEEAKMVNTTTLGIRDFHLVGINKQLDADKRIIHDSYMAFGSEDLEVPVAERYDEKIITDAGFEIVDKSDDGLFTIRGKKLGLLYNYTYTTRNTDDLPPNAAVIQGTAQGLEVISKDPVINSVMGVQDRIDLYNSFLRDLTNGSMKIKADPAKVAQIEAAQQQQQQLGQALPAIQQAIQALGSTIQKLVQQQGLQGQSLTALAQAVQAIAKGPKVAVPRELPTRQGQISPDFPIGSGAPPLNGVQQAPPIALAS